MSEKNCYEGQIFGKEVPALLFKAFFTFGFFYFEVFIFLDSENFPMNFYNGEIPFYSIWKFYEVYFQIKYKIYIIKYSKIYEKFFNNLLGENLKNKKKYKLLLCEKIEQKIFNEKMMNKHNYSNRKIENKKEKFSKLPILLQKIF